MSLFDAVYHAFSTIFYWQFHSWPEFPTLRPYLYKLWPFFMIVSGINFALHFSVLKRRNPFLYLADAEVKPIFWSFCYQLISNRISLAGKRFRCRLHRPYSKRSLLPPPRGLYPRNYIFGHLLPGDPNPRCFRRGCAGSRQEAPRLFAFWHFGGRVHAKSKGSCIPMAYFM